MIGCKNHVSNYSYRKIDNAIHNIDSLKLYDSMLLDSQSAKIYYRKALLLYTKMNESPVNELKKSISIDSNYYPSIKLLGILYSRSGQFKKAHNLLLKYYLFDSSDVQIMSYLITASIVDSDYILSYSILNKMSNMSNKDEIFIKTNLGTIKILEKKYIEAYKYLISNEENPIKSIRILLLNFNSLEKKQDTINLYISKAIDYCKSNNKKKELIYYELLYSILSNNNDDAVEYCKLGIENNNKIFYKHILKYYIHYNKKQL